jgi:hypothetical protein
MTWLTVFSMIITAFATCVIAYYSKVSKDLAKEIIDHDQAYHVRIEKLAIQHQHELSDLYQAIAIATLMGGSSNTGKVKELISTFQEHYKGKIQVFNNK